VVALAIIRDLYKGRDMARITSFVFMVFSLVPAVAPLLGQAIIWAAGWRAIFAAFVVFMGFSMAWMSLRLRETLPVPARQPFNLPSLGAGLREVLGNRIVQVSVLVQALCFCMLVTTLQITQPVMDETYGRGEQFPMWFLLIALLAATASVLNASLVRRLGMRVMVQGMLIAQLALSGGAAAAWSLAGMEGTAGFAVFIIWNVGIFFQAGITLGNMNAIAMESMGHRAGLTAAVMGALSTVLAVLISIPIGQAFDGHPTPIALAILACAIGALALMQLLPEAEPEPA
jgi:DHA1 family bicyclomycin/chloramphenicol resistance-like MFS transporter